MKSYIGLLLLGILLSLIFSFTMSCTRLDYDNKERFILAISDFIIMCILFSLFITGMFLIG